MDDRPFDFSRRVALVTGCGSESGIGHACARLLARLGAAVAETATTHRVEARAGELRAAGAAASAHVADLTVRDEAFALVEAVEREHGRLDVLMNAAGIAQSGIPAPDAAFFATDQNGRLIHTQVVARRELVRHQQKHA